MFFETSAGNQQREFKEINFIIMQRTLCALFGLHAFFAMVSIGSPLLFRRASANRL